MRYHVPVHSLAERVLSLIRRDELLKAGDRVGVAVSGGIDSVALLRLLLELSRELGIVLSVVHFNHRLRGEESDGDQEFVAGLAREHDLEFHFDGEDVARHAAKERVSVEAAARELRYAFFRQLLAHSPGLKPALSSAFNGTAEAAPVPNRRSVPSSNPGDVHLASSVPVQESGSPEQAPARLEKIVTGHTLDDQAETVLMRMIRGAGLRGLGGIHPRIVVDDDDGEFAGEVVRPLLAVRRRELKQFLKDLGQSWRDDSTNADPRFTRNRIRKLVVPLLEQEFNPGVTQNLAELAEIARGEEDYWENEVAGWLGTTVHWSEPAWAQAASREASLVQIAPFGSSSAESVQRADLRSKIEAAPWAVMNASLSRMWFLGESVAGQRRLVKAIGENAGIPLEFKHVEEILRFAGEAGHSGKALPLPLGWKLSLRNEDLVFVTPDLREPAASTDYDYELPILGRIAVNEAGSCIVVRSVSADAQAEYNPDQLLDAESLHGPLRVRNWRAGDRFWPAHTKSPKKIKELLQERRVAQPERQAWPVVMSGNEIVWVRGFATPARLRARSGRPALLITDEPLVAENQIAETQD